MKTFLISAPAGALALLLLAVPADAADVTMATCEDDYQAMLQAAEDNRADAIRMLEHQLARTADDAEAARLNDEINKSWETEEEYRNIAALAHRDCVKYVKAQAD